MDPGTSKERFENLGERFAGVLGMLGRVLIVAAALLLLAWLVR